MKFPLLVATVLLVAPPTFASPALAQKAGDMHIDVDTELRVNCNRPLSAQDFPVRIRGKNTIAADGSAAARWQITSVFTQDLNFSGKLGGHPVPIPGGQAQLRVSGRNGLLLTTTSPQHITYARVTIRGQSCQVRFDAKLKPGFKEYTLWSGSRFYYCDRPRVVQTTCRIY